MTKLTLNTPIAKLSKLSREHALGLKRLKLETVQDLLNHLPSYYSEITEAKNIVDIQNGEKVTLHGKLSDLRVRRSFKSRIPMSEAVLTDLTGSIKLIFLHQVYIAKMYQVGDFVQVTGLAQEKDAKFLIFNPEIKRVSADHIFKEYNIFGSLAPDTVQELTPVYRETKEISSLYLRSLLKKIFQSKDILEEIKDLEPLPEDLLSSLHLPQLAESYLNLHFPRGSTEKKAKDKVDVARKRMAFQEIFLIQVLKQLERARAHECLSYQIENDSRDKFLKEIKDEFGFTLTSAQLKAISEIEQDLSKSEPMSRLLEGDVGSGKTLVAAIASFLVSQNRDRETGKRLQVAIMAPTEILARQHFKSFIKFFKSEYLEIGLLTSKVCEKYPSKLKVDESTNISKAQLKKWVADGSVSVIIGTHALIQKNLEFQNLALVIIDEQHRFGVKQRRELANKKSSNKRILVANDPKNQTNKKQILIDRKEKLPHLLSMSATPIPRTLALTIFGDLDLSIIDELPAGRKSIETKLAKGISREEIYQEVIKEVRASSQAYVVVPRISELDEAEIQSGKKLNLRSVASEVKNLEKFLENIQEKNIHVAGLHSKMKKEEKEELMQKFLNNEIQILVSTSVIEVGVDVPNVTRMIIEGSERFGLAQLYQLRGRIGRGEKASICYLFNDSENEKTSERLNALLKARNGFELAEYDLEQRGIGSLISKKQWGASDLAMEAIKNLKLVEIAREKAKKIIEEDKDLGQYPNLQKSIQEKEKVHLE